MFTPSVCYVNNARRSRTPTSWRHFTCAVEEEGLANFPSDVLPFREERRESPVLLQRIQIQFPSVPVVPAIHSEWYT